MAPAEEAVGHKNPGVRELFRGRNRAHDLDHDCCLRPESFRLVAVRVLAFATPPQAAGRNEPGAGEITQRVSAAFSERLPSPSWEPSPPAGWRSGREPPGDHPDVLRLFASMAGAFIVPRVSANSSGSGCR